MSLRLGPSPGEITYSNFFNNYSFWFVQNMFCLSTRSFLMENLPHMALLHPTITHTAWKIAPLSSLFLLAFFWVFFHCQTQEASLQVLVFHISFLRPSDLLSWHSHALSSPFLLSLEKTLWNTVAKAANLVEGLNWTLQVSFHLIFGGFMDRFWYSFITVISG